MDGNVHDGVMLIFEEDVDFYMYKNVFLLRMSLLSTNSPTSRHENKATVDKTQLKEYNAIEWSWAMLLCKTSLVPDLP